MNKRIKSKFIMCVIGVLAAVLVINGINVLRPNTVFVPAVKEEEAVRINFMSSWAGVDSKSVIIEALIQDFNRENPDIEVVDMSLAGEDFLYTLKTLFASNEPPDVFGLWPGSDLDVLIERGKVADLKPVYDADAVWANSFNPTVRENFMSSEALYSIPFEMIYEGMFVNKAIMARYGVKVPETVEELYAAVRGLRNRGIVPIAFNVTPEGSFMIQNLMVSSQGVLSKGDVQKLYDGAGEAMTVAKALEGMKAFPENYLVLDDYGRDQLFKSGKAAMIFQGSWFMDTQMMGNEDIAFVSVPKMVCDQSNRMIYGIGNGNFHISKTAYGDEEKREAAIRFLKYLTSEKSVVAFSVLPGFASSVEVKNASDLSLNDVGSRAVLNADEISVPVDHIVDRTAWENDFVGRWIHYFEEDMSLEMLLDGIFGEVPASGVTQ